MRMQQSYIYIYIIMLTDYVGFVYQNIVQWGILKRKTIPGVLYTTVAYVLLLIPSRLYPDLLNPIQCM